MNWPPASCSSHFTCVHSLASSGPRYSNFRDRYLVRCSDVALLAAGLFLASHVGTQSTLCLCVCMCLYAYIQGVPGGKISILGGHSIGHSKQNSIICTYVLLRTVSEMDLFHCTLCRRARRHVLTRVAVQSALMLTVEFSKMYYTR
jgi:hypothetical protein